MLSMNNKKPDNVFYFCLCVCIAHMCASALVGQKKVLDSLGSGESVSCLMLVVSGNQTEVLL